MLTLNKKQIPDLPVSKITGLDTVLEDKVSITEESNKVYGTDANGEQTTYDATSFGQVDDVRVNGVSVVENKIANIQTTLEGCFVTSVNVYHDYTDDFGNTCAEYKIYTWSNGDQEIFATGVTNTTKDITSDLANWYRIHKDGWVEQGGLINGISQSVIDWSLKQITLPLTMSDTNYNVIANDCGIGSPNWSGTNIEDKSVNDFYYRYYNATSDSEVSWEVKGQGNLEALEPASPYFDNKSVNIVLRSSDWVNNRQTFDLTGMIDDSKEIDFGLPIPTTAQNAELFANANIICIEKNTNLHTMTFSYTNIFPDNDITITVRGINAYQPNNKIVKVTLPVLNWENKKQTINLNSFINPVEDIDLGLPVPTTARNASLVSYANIICSAKDDTTGDITLECLDTVPGEDVEITIKGVRNYKGAVDNEVVHKVGNETITGRKTFADSVIISEDTTPTLYIKDTTNDSTITPSENKLCQILVEDMNDVWTGAFQVSHRINGANISQILVRKQDASESESLAIGYGVNGELFTYAPTPASNNNNNSIVTTKWINQNRTNCLLEIPQDINFELNGNILTLKTGSKVYIPNGFEEDGTTRHFDIITITEDIESSLYIASDNRVHVLFYRDGFIDLSNGNQFTVLSGDTFPDPTATLMQNKIFYKIDENKFYYCYNNTWNVRNYSLPLGIIERATSSYAEITQVFNGFGYIGKTLFALPGISGVCPNGRNEDSSLKSDVVVSSQVYIKDVTEYTENNLIIYFDRNGIQYQTYYYEQDTNPDTNWSIWYNPSDNIVYYRQAEGYTAPDYTQFVGFKVGYFDRTLGNVFNLRVNKPYQAVNKEDTEFIAHQSMPSNKYIDLTLGASLAKYTAPADGYVVFAKKSGVQGNSEGNCLYSFIDESTGSICQRDDSTSTNSGAWCSVSILVYKNQRFSVEYSTTGETQLFRFIYANGSK